MREMAAFRQASFQYVCMMQDIHAQKQYELMEPVSDTGGDWVLQYSDARTYAMTPLCAGGTFGTVWAGLSALIREVSLFQR